MDLPDILVSYLSSMELKNSYPIFFIDSGQVRFIVAGAHVIDRFLGSL